MSTPEDKKPLFTSETLEKLKRREAEIDSASEETGISQKNSGRLTARQASQD
jgi:hypothetical protein